MKSRISGVGAYVPNRVVTNFDLQKMMDTSDEWIVQRSGIKERRYVEPNQSTSDLALEASLKAIESAKISKNDIDLIIVATLSPDHQFPGSACFLQAKLGLPNVPALDIRQQCSGFIYGLSIADQFIRGGMYKNILLVGAEIHSKALDFTTRGRDVTVLFGDGAGAVVVTASDAQTSEDAQVFSTHLYADGSQALELCTLAPGTAMGPTWYDPKQIEEMQHVPRMNGKKVFVSAIKGMAESLQTCLVKNQTRLEDVDLFLFHQANLRINEAVADVMKIPREKVFNTIHKYGNTTAATIPIGMNDAIAEGKLKPGMLVALSAFGSGFTWGAALLRY